MNLTKLANIKIGGFQLLHLVAVLADGVLIIFTLIIFKFRSLLGLLIVPVNILNIFLILRGKDLASSSLRLLRPIAIISNALIMWLTVLFGLVAISMSADPGGEVAIDGMIEMAAIFGGAILAMALTLYLIRKI